MKREQVDAQKRKAEEQEKPNKGGRPKIWTDERIQEEADALNKWVDKKLDDRHFDPAVVIWVKDFALERGIPIQYLSEWDQKHEGFREAYARARGVQESQLVNASLLKLHDAGMAKFVLVNNHKEGWADKQSVELGGAANTPPIVLEVKYVTPDVPKYEVDTDTETDTDTTE